MKRTPSVGKAELALLTGALIGMFQGYYNIQKILKPRNNK